MSYLIGDPSSGVAAVVDPTEEPGVFLQEASGLGLRIERVIETHTHQDHVSGAEALYHSVFDKILRLSDEVVVYPAHYGPHHGLPEDRFTTLGHERRLNEALTVKSKEDFIRYMMEGWPPKPGGWREISERNTSA